MIQTAIVIPAFNEQESLPNVISDLKKTIKSDVIIVDDASSDDTAKIASRLNAIVLSHVVNLGAWRATQTGIRFALKQGYERIITFDADGQHSASDIDTLIRKSEENYDLVIGSCVSRGSRGRHIAWRVFKRMTGLSVSDLTSGFRCYNHAAMSALASRQATMFEYQDVGILLMLRSLNLKSVEVSVRMNERKNGISRIFYSWSAVCKYLLYTLILSVTKAIPMSAKPYRKKLISGENIE